MSYLNELGSHGIRSYTTGFLIDDYAISLWYMDHMGAVKSTSFNWLTEPHLLVYFLASITYASFSQLGFFPLLKFPKVTNPAMVMESFQGVTLDIKKAHDIGNAVIDNLSFTLDVDEDRGLTESYGMIGRSTVVVPLKANPASRAAISLSGDERLVAKITWPLRSRDAAEPEDGHIRAIRKALSKKGRKSREEFLQNVVDLKCSLKLEISDADLRLPRASMSMLDAFGVPADSTRVCRVIIMKSYLPLTSVNGPDELKKVFVDVVSGMCSLIVLNPISLLT